MAKAKPAPKNQAAHTADADADYQRRPTASSQIPPEVIQKLDDDLESLRNSLEAYAAHLRAQDRLRLNGIGIKKQGLVERAFMLAQENQEFLPPWLTIGKFKNDFDRFSGLRRLEDACIQIVDIVKNNTILSADVVNSDVLAFYSQVQDAARRGIDPAESLYSELREFYRRGKRKDGKPTQAQVMRDEKALMSGKKNGRVAVENISPKMTGGSRRVIDETYKENDHYKDTESE